MRALIDEKMPLTPVLQKHMQRASQTIDQRGSSFLRIGSVYMRKGVFSSDDIPKLVHSPRTVERLELLAASCQSTRAVLLEGATASGKTALVQELARLAKRELIVIPMNQDVETSDLIGQWLPVTSDEGYKSIQSSVSDYMHDALKEITFVMAALGEKDLVIVTRKLRGPLFARVREQAVRQPRPVKQPCVTRGYC